jgi:hypothetical protein
LGFIGRHDKKDPHLNRYIKIIDKRYNESKMNIEYVFPRKEEIHENIEDLSRSSSIESMNGTLLYKLNRQNLKMRLKTMSNKKRTIINKPANKLLIQEKT